MARQGRATGYLRWHVGSFVPGGLARVRWVDGTDVASVGRDRGCCTGGNGAGAGAGVGAGARKEKRRSKSPVGNCLTNLASASKNVFRLKWVPKKRARQVQVAASSAFTPFEECFFTCTKVNGMPDAECKAHRKQCRNEKDFERADGFVDFVGSLTSLLGGDFSLVSSTAQNLRMKAFVEDRDHPYLMINSFEAYGGAAELMNAKVLSKGGRRMMDIPNAGGSSEESEVWSFEIIRLLFGAELLFAEQEIDYFPSCSKKTDYAVSMFGHVVGVSVTRAMAYKTPYTPQHARDLLQKKLFGVIVSQKNVVRPREFIKQILHVWTSAFEIANIVMDEFCAMDSELKANTILMVTVSKNCECLIYNGVETPLPVLTSD